MDSALGPIRRFFLQRSRAYRRYWVRPGPTLAWCNNFWVVLLLMKNGKRIFRCAKPILTSCMENCVLLLKNRSLLCVHFSHATCICYPDTVYPFFHFFIHFIFHFILSSFFLSVHPLFSSDLNGFPIDGLHQFPVSRISTSSSVRTKFYFQLAVLGTSSLRRMSMPYKACEMKYETRGKKISVKIDYN